jgi:hypothetical protein
MSFDRRAAGHARRVRRGVHTTGLFRLERWILRWLATRPSTNVEARKLARGERDDCAAWTVEQRATDQVLLRDFTGRTCSWLMVTATVSPSGSRLYFGSVVTRVRDS